MRRFLPVVPMLVLMSCMPQPADAPPPATRTEQQGAAPLVFTDIAAGDGHTCAIDTAGQAWCWGLGQDGELGNGTFTDSPRPVPVGGNHVFASIAAGDDNSCALTASGQAWCWGGNWDGQVGDGTNLPRNLPVAVAGGLVFKQIASGAAQRSCGITTSSQLWCWGDYASDSHTTPTGPALVPLGSDTPTHVDVGQNWVCATTVSGNGYCWGNISPAGIASHTPGRVPGSLSFTGLVSAAVTGCGRVNSGLVYCAGDNNVGQLGIGTADISETLHNGFISVSGGLTYTQLGAGYGHFCGLLAGGSVRCWGDNEYGQIGDGTVTERDVPTLLGGGQLLTRITTGAFTSCGLTAAGAAWCWGGNFNGEAGDGTIVQRNTPVAVVGP
jgi:alpha-tubulin suppressor-like RCC1 family protein